MGSKLLTGTLNPTFSAVTSFGKQHVSMEIGSRIWLAAPEEAMASMGIRAKLTFVFPE